MEEITKLAEKDSTKNKSELDDRLSELKSLNYGILECIAYVKINQNCSLMDAKTIVINSSAWISEKDGFAKHQEEQMDELLDAAKNDILKIEHIYSKNKTEIKTSIKPK